jgi:hypothetical protein
VDLAKRTVRLRGFDRFRVWLASPAWFGRGEEKYSADVYTRPKYDVTSSRKTRRYVFAQYILLLGAMSALMFTHHLLAPAPLVAACVALAGGLVAMGALLEEKRWAKPLELARLAATAVAVALIVRSV